MKILHILSKCIGISGLQGLDYLLSMKIMDKLKAVIKAVSRICDEENAKKILESAYR